MKDRKAWLAVVCVLLILDLLRSAISWIFYLRRVSDGEYQNYTSILAKILRNTDCASWLFLLQQRPLSSEVYFVAGLPQLAQISLLTSTGISKSSPPVHSSDSNYSPKSGPGERGSPAVAITPLKLEQAFSQFREGNALTEKVGGQEEPGSNRPGHQSRVDDFQSVGLCDIVHHYSQSPDPTPPNSLHRFLHDYTASISAQPPATALLPSRR
ncbi:hypothetical protein JCM1841_002131 [Sporobolomyces salmonicolor]